MDATRPIERADPASDLSMQLREARTRDTEPDQPRAHGTDQRSPHNWSAETRRANEDFLRVVYELRLRPFRNGFVPATWDQVAQRCPGLRDQFAANAKFRRLKKLYMTPGKLPEAMHQVFSTYLQETDPVDVVMVQDSSSRRGFESLSIQPVDTEMMRLACDLRLWMIRLDDTGLEDALEEQVAARMPGRSLVMVRTKIQQLVAAFKDSSHAHHNSLDRHRQLKQLVGEFVRVGEEELKDWLKRFAQAHLEEAEGKSASFDDVLLWGLKHVVLQSSSDRFSKAMYTKLAQFLNAALPEGAPVFRADNCMEHTQLLWQLYKCDDKEDFLTKTQIRTIREISAQKAQHKRNRARANEESKSDQHEPRELDEDATPEDDGEDRLKRLRLVGVDMEPHCEQPAPATTSDEDDAAITCAILSELARRSFSEWGRPDWGDIAKLVTNQQALASPVSGEDCCEAWLVYRAQPKLVVFGAIPQEIRLQLSKLDVYGQVCKAATIAGHCEVEREPEGCNSAVESNPRVSSSSSITDSTHGNDSMHLGDAMSDSQPARVLIDERNEEAKTEEASPVDDDQGGYDVEMEEVVDSAADALGAACRSHVITPVQEESQLDVELRPGSRMEDSNTVKKQLLALENRVEELTRKVDEQARQRQLDRFMIRALKAKVHTYGGVYRRVLARTKRADDYRVVADKLGESISKYPKRS